MIDHFSGKALYLEISILFKKYIWNFLLGHFHGMKLFPDGPKSLENVRTRVFPSSRYGFKIIWSKDIIF